MTEVLPLAELSCDPGWKHALLPGRAPGRDAPLDTAPAPTSFFLGHGALGSHKYGGEGRETEGAEKRPPRPITSRAVAEETSPAETVEGRQHGWLEGG